MNVIANARLAQEAQRRALVTAITGTPPATTSTPEETRRPARGFDGGARPMQLRAPESHDELVARLVLLSRTFRGETF